MNWRTFCIWLREKVFKLKKQVDELPTPTTVEANPTLAGTEADLEGLQVGDTKYKVPSGTEVVANPTLAGTEADLEGLQVGDTKYKVPSGGTEVVANPTLAGTEADLTGLQVGNTKYKVPAGGGGEKLYIHSFILKDWVTNQIRREFCGRIITKSNTPLTKPDFQSLLLTLGYDSNVKIYSCSGFVLSNNVYYPVLGLYVDTSLTPNRLTIYYYNGDHSSSGIIEPDNYTFIDTVSEIQ